MEKREIEIRRITDLRMIQFYEITGIAIKSSIPEGMPAAGGCAALAVYYGDNKRINMNATEPFFDLLVNRVFELYNSMSEEEKSAVLMNEYTSAVLAGGACPAEDHAFGRYFGLDPVETPEIPFESTRAKRFAPLIEFLALNIYRALGFELVVSRIKYGWRGAFTLYGAVNGEQVMLSCRVHKVNDGFYVVSAADFLKKNTSLTLNVETEPDYINLVYESAGAKVFGNSRFIFEDAKVAETHSIRFRDDEIFFENTENEPDKSGKIPEELKEKLEELLPGHENIAYTYRLPWGPVYVRYESGKEDGEISSKDYATALVFPGAEFAEIRGCREIQNARTGIKIKVDSFFMRRLLLSGKRMQLHFVPRTANANGRYREELEGKYFIVDFGKEPTKNKE